MVSSLLLILIADGVGGCLAQNVPHLQPKCFPLQASEGGFGFPEGEEEGCRKWPC